MIRRESARIAIKEGDRAGSPYIPIALTRGRINASESRPLNTRTPSIQSKTFWRLNDWSSNV